jgi:restriction system protein
MNPFFSSHHSSNYHHHNHPAYHQPVMQGRNVALLESTPATATPSILLQAVVILGDKVHDGHIIEAVAPAWFEIAKLLECDQDILFKIDSRKMEEVVAAWYQEYGYEVTLTPRSGDLGRDIIAMKRGILSVRIIDQVKAYKPGRLVPANDVRALLGVLGSDRAASKGLVTTTSDFAPKIETDEFIAPYLPTRLELVNGTELIKRLSEVANRK